MEFRLLEGVGDPRRGAGFLCQLAGADERRPFGVLNNFRYLQDKLFMDWPVFISMGNSLYFDGPLPGERPCPAAQQSCKGLDEHEVFLWASSPGNSVWPHVIPQRHQFRSGMAILYQFGIFPLSHHICTWKPSSMIDTSDSMSSLYMLLVKHQAYSKCFC